MKNKLRHIEYEGFLRVNDFKDKTGGTTFHSFTPEYYLPIHDCDNCNSINSVYETDLFVKAVGQPCRGQFGCSVWFNKTIPICKRHGKTLQLTKITSVSLYKSPGS